MWPKTKNFKMATGLKAGLYQNGQSASYLLPTLPYGHAKAKGLTKNKPIETQGALWWFYNTYSSAYLLQYVCILVSSTENPNNETMLTP